MHPTTKKLLTPLLSATTKWVDHSPGLQKLMRYLPFEKRASIVKRLTRFPDQKVLAKCKGIQWKLDLQDLLQRCIYYNCYDFNKLNPLLKHIKPGDTCIDVGSNVGYYALHIAQKMAGCGRLYSFEADPEIYQLQAQNCQLNDFAHTIELINKAVTHSVGEATFYNHGNDCCGSGSLNDYAHIKGKPFKVQTTSLDHFLEEEKIVAVDFIKIDAEGSEFEILEGSKTVLQAQRFGKIYIEFNGILLAKQGRDFHQFMELFSKYGYAPIEINLHLIEKLKRDSALAKRCVTDFLLAPR